MSSLRHPKRAESLDMLVDTMCDAFGTIILMAVLVSLLAQQTTKQIQPPPVENPAIEIVQRRIQQAEADLKDLIAANVNLQQQLQPAGIQDLAVLVNKRQQLRDNLATINHLLSNPKPPAVGGESSDPLKRQNQIDAAIRQSVVDKKSLENVLITQLKQNRDSINRIVQIGIQLDAAKVQEVRRLRLPRETDTAKNPLFVLLWEGKAFPIKLSPDVQNPAVENRLSGKDSTLLVPKSGRGMDPARIGNVVRQWPSDEYYIVFVVFEDSFSSFQAARQSVVNEGYNYGWKPFRENAKVVLVSGKRTGTQ